MHRRTFASPLRSTAAEGQLGFGGHWLWMLLLTRACRTPITAGERRWAQLLKDVMRRAKLPVWPVHRANDVELVVIAPDDLAATA